MSENAHAASDGAADHQALSRSDFYYLVEPQPPLGACARYPLSPYLAAGPGVPSLSVTGGWTSGLAGVFAVGQGAPSVPPIYAR